MGALYHNTKVYIYDTTLDYTRSKYYTRREITSECQQPIIFTDRVDTALDTASIVLLNKNKKRIQPFTRLYFDITSGEVGGQSKNTLKFYVVTNDVVNQVVYSSTPSKRLYKHTLQLTEYTKWLERFDVDNTTITNMLMFLYNDNAIVVDNVPPSISYNQINNPGVSPFTSISEYRGIWTYQSETNPFKSITLDTEGVIDCSCRLSIEVTNRVAIVIPKYNYATINSFKVKKPNGTVVTLSNSATSYTPDAYGEYTFTQVYSCAVPDATYTFTVTWVVKYMAAPSITKLPSRWTIAEVVDRVLGKVTRENSIRRESDTPMFQLDESQRAKLQSMISPEFTFTQSTLFGILSEIGSAIHAIPRLIVSTEDVTENGVTTKEPRMWNIIHFDFLNDTGNSATAPDYPEITISMEETQGSDNYATAMVSNVQNAFISTNKNYISITEPFGEGYISTRTETSDYEVSNDHCVIKVSRPIQRICELWCLYDKAYPAIDIASFCKEKADYSLLTDYDLTNPNTYFGQGTKQTTIYYTRGDTVIRGLDYVASSNFDPLNLAGMFGLKLQAIKYLLILALEEDGKTHAEALSRIQNLKLRDICFRIKYVPYLNFKVKQYRENITDDMETSTLFFNQDAQVVDCNAFGERIKGALNMTSNEEPTFTFVTKTPDFVMKSGQLTSFGGSYGQYFSYEVQRELSKKCCVTTIKYSKNFNKWNEYIAIKKNYRQYEISENESVEQTPIYSQFVIVDDDADFNRAVDVDPSDTDLYNDAQASMTTYINDINSQEGFIEQADDIIYNMQGYGLYHDCSVNYMLFKATGKEWDSVNGKYTDVVKKFMIPTTSFCVGNSAVINVGTKDNYSAGTTVTIPDNSISFGLEQDVQYGSKYGTIDKLQVVFGSEEYDEGILDSSKDQTQRGRQLYAVDDVKKTMGKFKIWNDALMVDKDSRQKINLTLQLNAVAAKDDIWIGSNFVERFGLNSIITSSLHFTFFTQQPDRFLTKMSGGHSVPSSSNRVTFTKVNCEKYGLNMANPTYKIACKNKAPIGYDTCGYGLIDSDENIVLYFNRPLKNGEAIENDIYIEFRERI